MIKAEGRTIPYEIRKLIISISNEVEVPQEWKESIILPIYNKGEKRDCSNYRGNQFANYVRNFILHFLLRLTPYSEEIIEDHPCEFRRNSSTTAFVKYLRKNWKTMKQCITSLETSRKLMIHLGGRSCIIFLLSLVSHETGKANKNMSD